MLVLGRGRELLLLLEGGGKARVLGLELADFLFQVAYAFLELDIY